VAVEEITWTATDAASVELKAICGAGGDYDKMWIAEPVTLTKAAPAVNCALGPAVTGADCQAACGVLTQTIATQASNGGTACDAQETHHCINGEGNCVQAKCSTVASAPADFCGIGKVIDATKSNNNFCAVAACNKGTAGDVTACCKAGQAPSANKATCSTMSCPTGKMLDSNKMNADCTSTTCSAGTAADVSACCVDVPKAEKCCSGPNIKLSCVCGSNVCTQGQSCSDGKCLHAEACPDGKPSVYSTCGCGGKDSDKACSRGQVCTASKKTCAEYQPPDCKATFTLAEDESCKCGTATCRSDSQTCDAANHQCGRAACPSSGKVTAHCKCTYKMGSFDRTSTCFAGQTCKDTGCEWPACPSSGKATASCSCTKGDVSNTCSEGETCTDGTCDKIAECKGGEKSTARCRCVKKTDTGGTRTRYCDAGRVCNLDESSPSCDLPKCSETVTEKCMCGAGECTPGMTCSSDDAKKSMCGCSPSKDLYCLSQFDNKQDQPTCPNACVGTKAGNGGGDLGKCQAGPSLSQQTICLKDGKSVKVIAYASKDCSGDPIADKTQTYEGCISGSQTVECVYDVEKAAAAGDADAIAEKAALESGAVPSRIQPGAAMTFAAIAAFATAAAL
jgi:hypothetical protein